MVTALESRSEKDLTLELVKGKLIDESKRQKNNRDDEKFESVMKTNERSCYFCKQSGHIKKYCPRYKVWKQKQENKVKKIDEIQDYDSDEEKFANFCFMTRFNISKIDV